MRSRSAAAARTPRRRRWPWWTAGILGAVVASGLLAQFVTPWPFSLAIRWVFERSAADTIREMDGHAPAAGTVTEHLGVPIDGLPAELTLDRFTPAGTEGAAPTVIWIHGGAWISGSSAEANPYLRLLAARGYTAIGVNYTRGPEGSYPGPLHEINTAIAQVLDRADEYGVDTDRIVLAGDSAGAQLASQLAVAATESAYAERIGLPSALSAEQLVGTILHCGIYDPRKMLQAGGIAGWGFDIALWAYTGERDWGSSRAAEEMRTLEHATENFPPSFISGGNGDGLTPAQSVALAERLSDLGVEVDAHFFPEDYEPAMMHEYQFHLDLPEARDALDATLDYLERVTAPREATLPRG